MKSKGCGVKHANGGNGRKRSGGGGSSQGGQKDSKGTCKRDIPAAPLDHLVQCTSPRHTLALATCGFERHLLLADVQREQPGVFPESLPRLVNCFNRNTDGWTVPVCSGEEVGKARAKDARGYEGFGGNENKASPRWSENNVVELSRELQ